MTIRCPRAAALLALFASLYVTVPVALPETTAAHAETVLSASVNAAGAHFLYVEANTCPDSIEGFKAVGSGLSSIGSFSTSACNGADDNSGSNYLAVTKKNSQHPSCLVLADSEQNTGSGFLDSFTINLNGTLGSEVSHLSSTYTPEDVKFSPNGSLLYVTYDGPVYGDQGLESYSLGALCALTGPLDRVGTANSNGVYFSATVISPSQLVAADFENGTLDTYALSTAGSIALQRSNPSQLPYPDATAATHGSSPEVFANILDVNSGTRVEGGALDTTTGNLTYLSGSPATDPYGYRGGGAWVDQTHSLFISGGDDGGLSVFTFSTGSMSFLEDSALPASPNVRANLFQQLGSTLVVDGSGFPGYSSSEVESCALATNGVSNCHLLATLPGQTYSNGMAGM